MKKYKDEIRRLIASYLLMWVFKVLPNSEFKIRFSVFIKKNIMEL